MTELKFFKIIENPKTNKDIFLYLIYDILCRANVKTSQISINQIENLAENLNKNYKISIQK